MKINSSRIEKRKKYAQYYSPSSIASLIVRHIQEPVANIIDFAAGVGDLLLPAMDRYRTSKVFAIDIDQENVDHLGSIIANGEAWKEDALNMGSDVQKRILEIRPDLVIGNPPYNKQRISSNVRGIIHRELGLDFSNLRMVRAELAFLALSLHFAKVGGCIALILPKSIASGARYQSVRSVLISKHNLSYAVDLPPSTFPETEAETTIFILRKGEPTKSAIKLLKADKSGNIENEIQIPPSFGAYRLDYDYHDWLRNSPNFRDTFSGVGGCVLRGSIHPKEARELGISIFHTSDFNSACEGVIHFNDVVISSTKELVKGKKNDILLPRVGRTLHQCAIVGSGESVISDSVFSLRIPRNELQRVSDSINSNEMKRWLKAHSLGTCAKSLTKADVLKMPIFEVCG